MVIICSMRWVLILSIIAARVVDFPLPVVPVTSTIPLRSWAIRSKTNGRFKSEIVFTCVGMTRNTIPTAPRCRNTLQRNRPKPATLYAISSSCSVLNFSFWRSFIMANAMAIVFSCIKRFNSTIGWSWPSIRSTGWFPTLRCKSDAPRSTAIFKRSSMFMVKLLWYII